MQYLYPEGSDFIFMDMESFEQIPIGADDLDGQSEFLLPNEEVQINFYNEQPIGIELPASVVLEVTETETVVKGQTAAGSGKPAIVETGLRVIVPPFVNAGDKIRINTDTAEYMERADS